MTALTKHDTILWINHAIANFKRLGKNQKVLAEKLSIDPERISEMKGGKGTISPNLMERIVDLCGAPRRNPGRFEYAEIYNDLESFFNDFDLVTENRFHRKLLKSLTSQEYINVILNKCQLEDMSHEDINQGDINSLILERINLLIIIPEFVDICYQYQHHLSNRARSFSFKWGSESEGWKSNQELKMGGLFIQDTPIFHCLYLIWLLTNKVPGFKFGDKLPFNLHPIKDLSPVVMTGKRILTIQSEYTNFQIPCNKEIEKKLGSALYYPKLHDHSSLFDQDNNKIEPQPDHWGDLRCEIYLSENMNYHLLIHLSHEHVEYNDPLSAEHYIEHNDREPIVKAKDRIAVITNINTLDLFRTIEEIRKWYGLPIDNNYELQQNIAKAGGYVPGARVLM
ncbi:MAG: helix-turn-helix transcriptional regulator [Flavobacteriaceae bacterium]|nr:helix-turn-helix transcriptional regulator [Flavobacteriaceae bacterium]